MNAKFSTFLSWITYVDVNSAHAGEEGVLHCLNAYFQLRGVVLLLRGLEWCSCPWH